MTIKSVCFLNFYQIGRSTHEKIHCGNSGNMKKLLSLLCLVCVYIAMQAQNSKVTVTGQVWDGDLNEAMGQASVQLLNAKDSAFVNGGTSQNNGQFTLPAVKAGNYLLKVSFIGYQSQFKPLQLVASRPRVNVGKISLTADAVMMKEAVVVGQLPPVQMSEDTVVYNAGAYKIPEGSALEELVKKLPGAEVDDNGKITINGKSISKILVDGKEFFGDDQDLVMKNIPVDMVEKLKTYERQSDLARITGIDDGEEQTVLDLSVKKEMKHGWISNADLAGGTEQRYSTKAMVSRFSDKDRITFMGDMNNTGDRGISGRGWGNNGLQTRKNAGLDYASETDKLSMGGNVRFGYNHNNNQTKSSSETFLDAQSSFANSLNSNFSTSNNFNTDFRFEWKPDTLTNIIARPNFSVGNSDSNSNSRSATFDSDPYVDGIDDPLTQLDDPLLEALRVNSNRRYSLSNSNSLNAGLELQYNRRLNNKGRNITFRGTGGYSNNDSESTSLSRIQYYRDTEGDESALTALNRYSKTPTKNWNYSVQTVYSEPIFKGGFLQFRYNFQYKYNKSDRTTYDIAPTALDDFTLLPGYNNPENLTEDALLSKFAEYRNYIHTANLSLRVLREKYRLNLGVNFVPQESKMNYKYQGVDTTVTRRVSNYSPNIRFRYRFSKQTTLRIDYRGNTSQPSMTDLLDITDDSDPLNITKGNPGLKPSFSNEVNVEYSTFAPESQRNIMVRANYTNTLNSISSKMTYDTNTGVRTTQPENINGSWNAMAMMGFSTAFKNQKFTMNSFTMTRYSNQPSFLFQNNQTLKNTTNNLNLNEHLRFNYRSDLFDVSVNGNIRYSNIKNELQPKNNMNTYNFSYGGEFSLHLPWNMEFTTNLSNSSRRGYSSASMNTDELIWNAQVAQNFLKGNAATVSFQIFDILRNQSNVSRNITASMRSDTEYNSINSYCMLHFIYRLNIFGSKEMRDKMKQMGGGFGPGQGGFGGERRGPGRPGGGPGGGRRF